MTNAEQRSVDATVGRLTRAVSSHSAAVRDARRRLTEIAKSMRVFADVVERDIRPATVLHGDDVIPLDAASRTLPADVPALIQKLSADCRAVDEAVAELEQLDVAIGAPSTKD